jgi:general secretion pathway protein K
MKPLFDKSERGVALVVVLWAGALVSLAMIGLAGHLQAQLAQERAIMRSSQALLVAESGVQMALHPQVMPQNLKAIVAQLNSSLANDWKPLRVRFEVESARDGIAGGFTGEEGRMNLNAILQELGGTPEGRQKVKRRLSSILLRLGVNEGNELGMIDRMVDCLIDWVDRDDQEGLQGAERGDYEEAGLNYVPPNRLFLDDLDEITKVMGWGEAMNGLREKRGIDWQDLFTIYGNGRLDLRYAEALTIEAWLGLAEGAANEFVKARRGLDGIDGTDDDPPLNPALLGVNQETLNQQTSSSGQGLWRITSKGTILDEEGNPMTRRTVVALISRDISPPQIRTRWIKEESVR